MLLKKKLVEQLNTKIIITYKELKPSIILFNNFPNENKYNELNKCTILTTYDDELSEYKELQSARPLLD